MYIVFSFAVLFSVALDFAVCTLGDSGASSEPNGGELGRGGGDDESE